MNKIGVIKGAINAKDQAKFRKDKDIRVSQEPKHKPPKGAVPTDVAFGMINRPSTPIREVISNTFGITAEQEILEKAKIIQTKPSSKAKQIRPTKSSTLLQQKIKNEDSKNEKLDKFKIKRFTKVESRVKAHMDHDKRKAGEESKE